MLHKETVEPATLDLIKKLQADPELKGFQMAGGTALAFMIWHAISIPCRNIKLPKTSSSTPH